MARNWAEIGITWVTDEVCEQLGDNATDKRVLNIKAQLPVISDLDKAAAAGISILAWLNSANSMRVRAQAIARTAAKKGQAKDEESLRERVFQALLGVRMSAGGTTVVERTIVKRALPSGAIYEGADEMEFRQALLLDLTENFDVPFEKAQEKALAYQW